MQLFKKNGKARQIQSNQQAAEKALRAFSVMEESALFAALKTDEKGLTTEQQEERIEEVGPNTISTAAAHTLLKRLYEAFVTPFNLILFVIAIITYITDVVASEQPDYLTVFIILLLMGLSGTVALIQSRNSDAAVQRLTQLVVNRSAVLRDGMFSEIPMSEVVPGDIVRLSAGDMLPADLRFLSTKDTFIAQAALTGESNPVEKFATQKGKDEDSLTDIQNLGFMGSNVISGSAIAVVLSTGNNTFFGTMAKSLSGDRAKTSFEKGVDAVSRLLVRMMLIMVPVVFLINGVLKNDWVSALLFAISLAVGLTPEMLPVIMTSTLARGAVTMSRHKVIVRSLGAIQTFGEMDVLCTDKTGTLTEDKIVLERYMNLSGEDDDRILRHAFFNSYFQTGLKNLIDLAIIQRAEQNGLTELLSRYQRVDEIPFDFSRRRMSVVLEDTSGKRQLITKGAVEEMLAICTFTDMDGQVMPMNDERRRMAMKTYEMYNAQGLRMIALAQKNEVPGSGAFSVADERDMVLLGFVGFLDPPKASAAAAITALTEHGVRTVVLTGDSEGVAVKVCDKVGVDTSCVLSGRDVEAMDEATLRERVKVCSLFAKLSPSQKERVVAAFQDNGHTVGYMGDGINDAPALRRADVGISVDSAVDIAKETADIILLQKDLMVLEEGVLEGRRTFGNIIKYIKMAASGNFGNMISVVVASIFLPFLPILPVQLLTQNLLCDFSQMGMAFDQSDPEYLLKPRKWDASSIKTSMMLMGPLSSIFDILCFLVLWFVMGANNIQQAPLFRSGWFVFGTVSQVAVIHMIRTSKVPFIQSRPSLPLVASTLLASLAALAIVFSNACIGLDMHPLPLSFLPWLVLLILGYCFASQWFKKYYIKRFGEWL